MDTVNYYMPQQRYTDTHAQNPVQHLNAAIGHQVQQYHYTFPQYTPSPLVSLTNLAAELGLDGMYVKDESGRFNLKAFKILGGTYAVGQALLARWGLDLSVTQEQDWQKKLAVAHGNEVTFITATDGNHGRSVAWSAQYFGQKSVVYMPRGSSQRRVENIERLGAKVIVTDYDFDTTARIAQEQVNGEDVLFAQDIDFPGHETFPVHCMQGYMTMPYEAITALTQEDKKPTHVFVQAGAGLLAGAVTGFINQYYSQEKPKVIVVESQACSCFLSSAQSQNWDMVSAPLQFDTMMAGLSAGDPCPVGWKVIRQSTDAYVACADVYSANGMRILGNPLGDDAKIVSGESGAVCVGLVHALMKDTALQPLKEELGLDSQSLVLCFSTEGDTDEQRYRDVVWLGESGHC